MNDSKFSSNMILKFLGCIVFDLAIIVAYSKIFGLFVIIMPIKSIIMISVLLVGLLIFNMAIILPGKLFKITGAPYSAAISTMFVLYFIVSNFVSIMFVPGDTIGYLVWELIIFAALLISSSVVIYFIKNVRENVINDKKEQSENTLIMLQLIEVENAIKTAEKKSDILPCLNCFKTLKERISASTPFGRINENTAVLDVENQIMNNLTYLIKCFNGNLNIDLPEINRILEDSLRLVITRESLNIK